MFPCKMVLDTKKYSIIDQAVEVESLASPLWLFKSVIGHWADF